MVLSAMSSSFIAVHNISGFSFILLYSFICCKDTEKTDEPKYFLKYSMRIPIMSQIMLNFARKTESYGNKEEFNGEEGNDEE